MHAGFNSTVKAYTDLINKDAVYSYQRGLYYSPLTHYATAFTQAVEDEKINPLHLTLDCVAVVHNEYLLWSADGGFILSAKRKKACDEQHLLDALDALFNSSFFYDENPLYAKGKTVIKFPDLYNKVREIEGRLIRETVK